MVKVNFDAIVTGTKAVAGIIVRNSNGQLLRAGHILLDVPIYFAELYAAWLGFWIAVVDLKAMEIWLEGDNIHVIQDIDHATLNPSLNNPLMQDILI